MSDTLGQNDSPLDELDCGDLMNLDQGEHSTVSDETVGEKDYIVPKKEVDYLLWNRLTGKNSD